MPCRSGYALRLETIVGRRADITPDQTRAGLLAAATRLFAEPGVCGTSLRQIAGEAGVHSAAVAYHFGDKAGLEAAVVDSLYEQIAEIQARVTPERLMDLDAFVADIWEAVYTRRDAIRVVYRGLLDRGELDHDRGWGWLEGRTERLATLLATATGRDVRHLRQTIISLSYVASRYALNHEQELCMVMAVDTVEEAHAAVASHLTDLLRALL